MSNLLPSLSPLLHITLSTSPDAPYTSSLHSSPGSSTKTSSVFSRVNGARSSLCALRSKANVNVSRSPSRAAGGISKIKAAKRGGRTGPTDRQRPMLKDLGAEINSIKTSGEALTMIE